MILVMMMRMRMRMMIKIRQDPVENSTVGSISQSIIVMGMTHRSRRR